MLCPISSALPPNAASKSSSSRCRRLPTKRSVMFDAQVPICADESVHTAADLGRLEGLYDAVNIKLDKAGGLTGAIALLREARRRDLKVMIGSMVATSLAVAPAMLLASEADWIDLDGPLLLARDRQPALRIEDGRMFPPSASFGVDADAQSAGSHHEYTAIPHLHEP